ncbi:tail fiber protein [Clostridium botulinum]|uniref:phage tail protein n=1 Tax=Clostridium botulinum TaxID=1491 RepID=UPI002247F7BC|nr:phage tail protein [Clostridium botulinum]UZP04242.1 tail fiber protein [Clostridium botulinum]UZP07600.1 tail fiber protein [Clostridium botulinum]UZP10981.1 tail fiber protein [Clostridium botulinum]
MKLTSNYSLKKPDGSDVVNIQDINDNSDKIDLELKKVDSSLKEIANKVDNIKIADGTTTQKGIVQLSNAVNSTAQNLASTPQATKIAYDKAVDALSRANEAFTSASNGKNYIAPKVGNVTGNNTFTEIGDRIQTDKNTAASNLNSKGISASGNEALASLAGKIASINVENMMVSGTVDEIWYGSPVSITLPFTPKLFLATYHNGYSPNGGIGGLIYSNNFSFLENCYSSMWNSGLVEVTCSGNVITIHNKNNVKNFWIKTLKWCAS